MCLAVLITISISRAGLVCSGFCMPETDWKSMSERFGFSYSLFIYSTTSLSLSYRQTHADHHAPLDHSNNTSLTSHNIAASHNHRLTKHLLLLRTFNWRREANAILCVELNSNFAKVCSTAIDGSAKVSSALEKWRLRVNLPSLDADVISHNLQLSIERASTSATEKVLVDFARVTQSVPGLWCTLSHFEGGTGNDDVRRISAAGPFLAARECYVSAKSSLISEIGARWGQVVSYSVQWQRAVTIGSPVNS